MSDTFFKRVHVVQELLAKDSLLSHAEIARRTGISKSAVGRCIEHLRKRGLATSSKRNELSTPKDDLQHRRTQAQLADYKAKYAQALDLIQTQSKMLETYAGIGETPKVAPIQPIKSERREVCPVIVASDWHIEETVSAAITNGMNEYNLVIAEDSAKQFFNNAALLINQTKRDSEVNTVVVAVLGDIINGVLREEDLQNNQQTSIEAVTTARSLLYKGLKSLASNTGCNLRVICCVGNHGRLTGKIFPSNQVRNSLEYLLYKTLQRDFRDHPTVDVIVSEAGYYIQDIYGVRVRFHHGHTFKFFGGIGGLAVPVLRKISQLNLIEKADLDVCGHFHSMQIFNNCILNGSLVGTNGFSIQLGMPYEPPRQTFFLIDSKYGRSVVAPIFIDRKIPKDPVHRI